MIVKRRREHELLILSFKYIFILNINHYFIQFMCPQLFQKWDCERSEYIVQIIKLIVEFYDIL